MASAFEVTSQDEHEPEVHGDDEEKEGYRDRCIKCFDSSFYNLGVFTARHPVKIMICCIILTFSLSSCYFMLVEEESRPEELWVPQDTQSKDDLAYLEDNWPRDEAAAEFIMFKFKTNDGNGLSAIAMQEMLRVHNLVLSVNSTAEEHNDYYPEWTTYDTKCAKKGNVCWRSNMLDIYDIINETLIAKLDDAEVLNRTNEKDYWIDNTGEFFAREMVLGGIPEDYGEEFNPVPVTNVVAIMATYYVQLDEFEKDGDRDDYELNGWESDLIDLFEDFQSDYVEINWFLQRTWSDEFTKLLSSDIGRLIITYMIILTYAILNLGRFHCIESAVGVSISTVISVMFAVYTSFGICALAGIFYSPLNNALTFLLLGLGVDDAFVITAEYNLYAKKMKKTLAEGEELDIEDLMGKTMMAAGQSILVTSLTDFLVFMLGALTILPALSSFCTYAAVGVLCDFFYQITFFSATLVLNHHRVSANRRDLYGCFTKVEDEGDCVCCPGPAEETIFEKGYKKLAEQIKKKPVAIFGVVLLIILVGFGINGLIVREAEFNLRQFLGDDTAATRFLDDSDLYFSAPSNIGVYVKDIDYFARQDDMKLLHEEILTNDLFDNSWGLEDWHNEFLLWANDGNVEAQYLSDTSSVPKSITNENMYYTSLQTFINGDGTEFTDSVHYDDDSTTKIKMSKITTFFDGDFLQEDGVDRYNAMEDLRDDISNVMAEAFPYFFDFIFWEEFGVIKREFLRNVIIAMVVIAIVTLCLITEVQTAGCVMVAIIFSLLDVAGFAHYWGLKYNGVVMIYSLIALGLTVDYSIHIGYKYSTVYGTRAERMETALSEMGPAVQHGVLSTFLAIIVLSTSQSFIFEVFFRMFFLATTLGGLHGLFILPCLLVLFGPEKLRKDIKEGIDSDKVIV